MEENELLKIGDIFPDFVLKDQHNRELRGADLAGSKLLLSFHPLAWTKVCTQQMKALETNIKRFDALGLIALGISVDPVPSKHAWARDMGVRETRLLSDFWPHGALAREAGLFREKEGFSERANVIINETRKVIFIKVYDIAQLPDVEELVDFLKKEEK